MSTENEIIVNNLQYFTFFNDASLDAHFRAAIPMHYVRRGLSKECYLVEQTLGGFNFIIVLTGPKFNDYASDYLKKDGLGDADYLERKMAFFSRVRHQELSSTKPRISFDIEMREHLRLVSPSSMLAFVGAGDIVMIWRLEDYKAWWNSKRGKIG